MKFIRYDNDIGEQVQQLIDSIEGQEDIKLHFSTNGGSVAWSNYLVEYLNTREDVEIILDGQLDSAGFNLILYTTCPIIVAPTFLGSVLHLTTIQTDLRYEKETSNVCTDTVKVYNENYVKDLANIGVNVSKLSKLIDGHNIGLSRDEVVRIIEQKKTLINGKEKEAV